MRRAFLPSHRCNEHEFLGRKVTSTLKLVMALFMLPVSTTGYGQSGKNSSSSSTEITSTADSSQTYHSAGDDLRLSSDPQRSQLGKAASRQQIPRIPTFPKMESTSSPENMLISAFSRPTPPPRHRKEYGD